MKITMVVVVDITDTPDESDDGWLIDPDYDYLNDPNFQQVTCGLSFCIDAAEMLLSDTKY